MVFRIAGQGYDSATTGARSGFSNHARVDRSIAEAVQIHRKHLVDEGFLGLALNEDYDPGHRVDSSYSLTGRPPNQFFSQS